MNSLGFDRSLDMEIEEHESEKCEHEFERVGNTERIDKYTLALEIQCLKCGLRDQEIQPIEETELED